MNDARGRRWSSADVDTLHRMHGSASQDRIAHELGCSRDAVKNALRRYGLSQPRRIEWPLR